MNLDDKIIAYLEDTMTDEERARFELDIKADPDLKQSIFIIKTMNTVYSDTDWALYNGDNNTLKNTSELFKGDAIESFSKHAKIAASNYKSATQKRRFIKYISSVAAAVIILFSGYYFLNNDATSITLYNNYYSTEDLPSFTTQSNTANVLAKAENLFKTKQYKKALEQFKLAERSLDNTLNPNLLLYIAVCYLELEQYQLAQERLNLLLKSNSLDAHKAYWFKALTYLKQDNRVKAIETLELLIEDKNNFNYLKAKKLLNELK